VGQSVAVAGVLSADQQLQQQLVVPALATLAQQLNHQAALLKSVETTALQDVRSEKFFLNTRIEMQLATFGYMPHI
jgi:hypothetical protein